MNEERTRILLADTSLPPRKKQIETNQMKERRKKENRERTDKIFRFYFYISEREADNAPIFLYLVAIVGYIPIFSGMRMLHNEQYVPLRAWSDDPSAGQSKKKKKSQNDWCYFHFWARRWHASCAYVPQTTTEHVCRYKFAPYIKTKKKENGIPTYKFHSVPIAGACL